MPPSAVSDAEHVVYAHGLAAAVYAQGLQGLSVVEASMGSVEHVVYAQGLAAADLSASQLYVELAAVVKVLSAGTGPSTPVLWILTQHGAAYSRAPWRHA